MEQNKSFINEKVKKKSLAKKVFLPLIGVVTFLIIGLSISFLFNYLKKIYIPNMATQSVTVDDLDSVYEINSYNDLVKMAINIAQPSVVSITTLSSSGGNFLIPMQSESAGSGIVFHKTAEEVFIVTNYHVIENADNVGIAFGDGEPVSASFIGADPNYDLAVISVKCDDLSEEDLKSVVVAKFVDTEELKVGDYSIAIGNALGEGITSTYGIVSSVSTDVITDRGNSLNVLQTTAAINPGNSGGALINLKGEIIGINTAKVSDTAVESVGYTISSSVAMPVIENIINGTEPATLGVRVTDVDENTEDILGGALVVEVIENSSADKEGIKTNDIITSINKTPILSSEQLVDEMKKYSVGDTLEINVIRDGNMKKIKVKLYKTQVSNVNF